MIIESGCYNCKNREVGCHANCGKYKRYREALDVINIRRRNFIEYYKSSKRRYNCGKYC